jgi:hypothetical protein
MITCQIPSIKRARGFRLYTTDGRRLTDLYLDGGCALLGHKNSNVVNVFKNACEKGLLCNYPNKIAETRFNKALSALFPGKCFRWYRTIDTLNLDAVNARCLILAFPLSPQILVLDEADVIKVPPSAPLSGAVLAASTRIIYDYLAVKDTRFSVNYPKIDAYFASNTGKSTWRRDTPAGIYIRYAGRESLWLEIFEAALEAGFLFPPDTVHPIILNGELSDGEVTKLLRVLKGTRQ